MNDKLNFWLNIAYGFFAVRHHFSFHRYGSGYQIRILSNIAIFITLAVSYNLVNGVCGLLHLGPNGFIAIGAYTSALLSMTPAEKQLNFILDHVIWPLSVIQVPFVVSLLGCGLCGHFFRLPHQLPGSARAR